MDDLDDIGGCPGEWDDNTEYEEGDQVFAMTDEVSTPSSQSCFSPTPAPTSPTVSPRPTSSPSPTVSPVSVLNLSDLAHSLMSTF